MVRDDLTLVVKGDFKILGNQKTFNELYTVLQPCLDILSSKDFIDDKRELTFSGDKHVLYGHKVKIIENKKIKTITIILK